MTLTTHTIRPLRTTTAWLLTFAGNHTIHWLLVLLSTTVPNALAHTTGHNGPLLNTTGSLLVLLVGTLLVAGITWLSRHVQPDPPHITHPAPYVALSLVAVLLWALVPAAAVFTLHHYAPTTTATALTTAHAFLTSHHTPTWVADALPALPTTTHPAWTLILLDTWLTTALAGAYAARHRCTTPHRNN